jgi:alkanesulfonate monooxygenase SsuD/methylene tetrahydromethanopterin reductase-like flavin-dependent oxidoreductase (luciferase family)
MHFALQTSGEYEEVLAAARWAEDNGLAAFGIPDHYLMALTEEQSKVVPAPDAFAQLAGLARETATIALVMLVSPITFRHPAVLAKSAVTIDRMSGGRFALGLGTGWLDREHEVFGFDYPPIGERFEMLEEALRYIRAAIDPDAPGYKGNRYVLEAFPLAPGPVGLRIVVGGTGPHKTPYLAGTYADEYNAYPGPDMRERIAIARRAAVAAGRDPEALLLSSSGQVVAAETQGEVEDELDRRAAGAGMTREQLDAAFARRRTPVGTYEQLRRQFAAMEELGISRFYLQGGFDPERIGPVLRALSD